MRHLARRVLLRAWPLVSALILAMSRTDSYAQPAASFSTDCAGLRAAMATLDFSGDPLIVIEVSGTLTVVRPGFPSGLAMCEPPAPRVICVTYSVDELEVGRDVVFSGSIARRSANQIMLDPCLHYRPD